MRRRHALPIVLEVPNFIGAGLTTRPGVSSAMFFVYVSSFSGLAPLLRAITQWRTPGLQLRMIFWLGLASVLSDGTSLVLIQYGINTWPIVNLFLIFQMVVFFLLLSEGRRIPVLRGMFIVCAIFAVVNFFFIQGPRTFNSTTSYAGGIILIITALSYLHHLLNEMPAERVQSLPLFWITFGVLIYYGGTLFLFLFNNYLIANQPALHRNIWILHNLLNITKNIFLTVSIWRVYQDKPFPS